ncbi:MAG TPA: hypothetical protein VN089_14880 [Duganella sp.]|nr:hypothetical protein [Duganella sp.]
MNANSDKDYIDAKTEAVRAGMDGRLDTFEANVNGRFAEMNAKFDTAVAELNAKIDKSVAELNAKIDTVAAELNAKIDKMGAELRKEIADASARMVQWMVGIFLASMAIFITVMTFVLNNAVPKAAPVTPPVIIQLSPQGVTLPAPAAPAVKPRP